MKTRLNDAGFIQCVSGMCLYYKGAGDKLILVGVYVNNLLVTATTDAGVDWVFTPMDSILIKNLGPVSKRLDFELLRLIQARMLWIRRRRLASCFG